MQFIVLAILFIAQSCKKTETDIASKESSEIVNQGQNMRVVDDSQTEEMIRNFIHKMNVVRKNPESEEAQHWNYSKDSSVWYVEAAINYQYALHWQYEGNAEHSDMYNIDSSFVSITGNSSGDFNILALQQAYDSFEAKLIAQYEMMEAENKFFVLSDININTSENNIIELKQYSVIAKADIYFLDQGWVWGLNYGNCMNSFTGIDAADILENRLSASRAYKTSTTGVYFHTDIDVLSLGNHGYIRPFAVWILQGSTNPTTFLDSRIFINPYSAGDVCLSVADINWYKKNILSIEGEYAPANKTIVFTDVIDKRYSPAYDDDNITHNIHLLLPHYGVLTFRAKKDDPID